MAVEAFHAPVPVEVADAIDFPTLQVAYWWLRRHCVVPDGFDKGKEFVPVGWQTWALLNFYRLKPSASVGQLGPAFVFRRAQIVLPQKAGKAPYTAAHTCVEAVGPALFAGWAVGGECWDCRDHGCGCGWVYRYAPGEAMGQQWPTPLIQITAFSEKQTDNIYRMLRPMIDNGPLSAVIPKTGESFIRLPNDGRIDVVTAEAQSRLGNPVTFVPQDETGIWRASNGMIKVAETQRRGLAGMRGRAEETSNAWDPNEGSVAQRTAEDAAKLGDVFRIHPVPPRGLSYRNKAERRKIHQSVYAGCSWIDLDGIEGEALELLGRDPGQSERFFGNRPVAGAGLAFDMDRWDSLVRSGPHRPPRNSVVVLGVDGALREDALAVIACDVKTGYVWTVDIVERPEGAGDEYKHDLERVDRKVTDVFDTYQVWRAYCDPQYIRELMVGWQNRWGARRVVDWETYRERPIAWAVRRFEEQFGENGELRHDGDPVFRSHIAHAHKKLLRVLDDKEQQMHSLCKEHDKSALKMDAAMAAVLVWEACLDCRKMGGEQMDDFEVPEPATPKPWVAGRMPALSDVVVVESVGPVGLS